MLPQTIHHWRTGCSNSPPRERARALLPWCHHAHGDGDLDVATANYHSENVSVLLNNGDGVIDPLDAGFVQARLGCLVGSGDPECDASDVNADLIVDPLDVGFVLARLGICP